MAGDLASHPSPRTETHIHTQFKHQHQHQHRDRNRNGWSHARQGESGSFNIAKALRREKWIMQNE